jgi:serine/threonine protein kinase
MGVVYMAEQIRALSTARWPSRSSSRGMDTQAGHRPLRGRAAGAGADGPSEHRQGARCRRHRHRPAVLRDGAGQRASRSPKYCDDTACPPRSGWSCSSRLPGGAARASEGQSSTATSSPERPDRCYDGKPVPKVIDFGVAKATGQRLTEATLFTGFGAVVGTPSTCRPSRRSINQLDVDTRSDIYSLGVLLYELLTGTTPLEGSCQRGGAAGSAARDPRGGAAQAEHAADARRSCRRIAAQRGLEPKTLSGIAKANSTGSS